MLFSFSQKGLHPKLSALTRSVTSCKPDVPRPTSATRLGLPAPFRRCKWMVLALKSVAWPSGGRYQRRHHTTPVWIANVCNIKESKSEQNRQNIGPYLPCGGLKGSQLPAKRQWHNPCSEAASSQGGSESYCNVFAVWICQTSWHILSLDTKLFLKGLLICNAFC